MRRGRGRCVICTANSDEFPTFEPESYLSSRSLDCLLRAVRSFTRAAVPSITRSVKRAHLRSMIRNKEPFSSPSVDPNAKRTLSEQDLSPPIYGPEFLVRVSPRWRERKENKEEESRRKGERDITRRRGLPATRVGGTRLLFPPYRLLFFSLFILCLGERDKKDDALAKFDTSNSLPRTCSPNP